MTTLTTAMPTRGLSLRSLPVVLNPKVEDLNRNVDWSSWYLTDEDDMGESCEQFLIVQVLLSCICEWAAEQNWDDVFIGADQFFAWVPEHPLVRISPDVYLLDHPLKPLPGSWQMWLPGHRPPRLAFEIVSEGNWRKDYQDIPKKYAQLGTKELVIFDPEAAAGRTKKIYQRFSLQIFRRAANGLFNKIYSGLGPVHCEELNAWLVSVEEDKQAYLRIARNAEGTDLVPTTVESKEREMVFKEQERVAKEQERMFKEQEQLARKEAERLLAEALMEIEKLKQVGVLH